MEARHKEIVDTRIRHETNETLEDLGTSCCQVPPQSWSDHTPQHAQRPCIRGNNTTGIIETGEEGEITVRFFENEDCVNAYKNYFCWLNFPRCNDEDRSLIMCRSACENFFDSCQVHTFSQHTHTHTFSALTMTAVCFPPTSMRATCGGVETPCSLVAQSQRLMTF